MENDIPSRVSIYTQRPFLYHCHACKQKIYNGDIFYNVCGKQFHKDCIEENYTTREILTLVGIKEEIAQAI